MFTRPRIDYNLDPMINLQSEFQPISFARNNFSRLIDFIDIPFNFDWKPKDLELWRFEAQFYGYYYDRKRTNYVLWASVGLKRNYGLLMPLFYYSPKRLKYNKRFKSINDDSWFFYYYLFQNSFGSERKDLSILERYYANTNKVRWSDYESRENSLLSLSTTTVRLQYPKNKFKWFVEEKRFEIDHSISVYDYEWRRKNFNLTSTSLSIARMSIRDLINPSFLSTSVYINNYDNRRVNSPDTYFAYRRTIHFLSKCFSSNPIIFKSRASGLDHNWLYKKYKFMLLKSYSLLFKSNFDKFTKESRTRFLNTKYLLYKYYISLEYRNFCRKYIPTFWLKHRVYGSIFKSKGVQFDMKWLIKSFERVEFARKRWLKSHNRFELIACRYKRSLKRWGFMYKRVRRQFDVFNTTLEAYSNYSLKLFGRFSSDPIFHDVIHSCRRVFKENVWFSSKKVYSSKFFEQPKHVLNIDSMRSKFSGINDRCDNFLYDRYISFGRAIPCDFSSLTYSYYHSLELLLDTAIKCLVLFDLYKRIWKRYCVLYKEKILAYRVQKRLLKVFKSVRLRENKMFRCGLIKNYKSFGIEWDMKPRLVSVIYKRFRKVYYAETPLNYIKYFIYLKKLLNVFSTYTLFARKSNPLGCKIKYYHNMVKGWSDDTSNWNRLWNKIMLMRNRFKKICFRTIFFSCGYEHEPLGYRINFLDRTRSAWNRCQSKYLKLCNYIAYAYRNAPEDLIKNKAAFWFKAYQQEKSFIDDEKIILLKEIRMGSYEKNISTDFYKNFHLRSGIAFRMYITKVNDLKAFVFFRLNPNLPFYRQNHYELKGFIRRTSYINWSSTFLYCKSWNKLQQYLPFLNNIWDNLFFFIKLKLSNCQIHSYTYSHFIRLILNYFMNLKNVLGSDKTKDALNPNALDYCIYNSRKRSNLNISWKISNFISRKKIYDSDRKRSSE